MILWFATHIYKCNRRMKNGVTHDRAALQVVSMSLRVATTIRGAAYSLHVPDLNIIVRWVLESLTGWTIHRQCTLRWFWTLVLTEANVKTKSASDFRLFKKKLCMKTNDQYQNSSFAVTRSRGKDGLYRQECIVRCTTLTFAMKTIRPDARPHFRPKQALLS